MSLAKIPFLISTVIAVHVTATPPNLPPPPQERVKPKGFEAFFLMAMPWIPLVAKIHVWALVSIEIIVILANAYPSSPFSKLVVSNLTRAPAHHLLITNGFLLASLAAAIGGFIRVLSYRTLGRFFTFELSVQKEHRLITSGPYAWVRHPSYTGIILVCVGGTHSLFRSKGSWLQACSGLFDTRPTSEVGSVIGLGLKYFWTLCVVGWIGVMGSRISREDEMLKKEFGKQWEEWAKKVPSRLIPNVY